MIHPIAFIEHGDVLIIERDAAKIIKEKPQQVLWINKYAYTIVPIEVVRKEVVRAINVDKLQGSNCSSLYFPAISAIEIPRATNIDPATAITNGRLKDAVPFNIDYNELERRVQKLEPQTLPEVSAGTGRFEFVVNTYIGLANFVASCLDKNDIEIVIRRLNKEQNETTKKSKI